jgi:hypothetical protein
MKWSFTFCRAQRFKLLCFFLDSEKIIPICLSPDSELPCVWQEKTNFISQCLELGKLRGKPIVILLNGHTDVWES